MTLRELACTSRCSDVHCSDAKAKQASLDYLNTLPSVQQNAAGKDAQVSQGAIRRVLQVLRVFNSLHDAHL